MKKQLLSNVILAFCLGLVSNELFAQDECTNAVNLTSNSVNGLTTAGSTSSSASMGVMCSQTDRDVWYKFTAQRTTTTTVKVTPVPGNIGDPVLSMYTGCSAGALINPPQGGGNCADVNSNSSSEEYTNLSVTAGTTYYIRIGEFTTGGGTINFGITLSGTVLPVELTSFNAQIAEVGKTNLTWSTASERGTSHFDIERSRDSKTFEKVGEVKAKGEVANYAFTDSKAVSGTSYYRLKMVDFDGTTDYSKIVSVQSYGKGKVKIYPTVTADNLVVEGAKSVTIVNMMGQVVLQREMNSSVVSLQELPKGIYIVKGEATEGGTFLEKIVKE